MESHLLQMRGLKRLIPNLIILAIKSHLLQMRGLKHESTCQLRLYYVASFTDAWIETDAFKTAAQMVKSHLLQMRGLKHTPNQNDGYQE